MTVLDRIRLTGPSAPYRFPRALPPGATIGVAALSGRVDGAKLDAGIARLSALGYRVREASNLRHGNGDFAGTDNDRAEGYRALVADPEIDAIFFARGGWGAARILHLLDADEIASRPKIHMGGSDLTTLFAYLHAHARLVCFHGPMVAVDFARADPDPATEESWQAVLSGVPQEIPLAPAQIVRPGSASAPVVGGCLSMLVALEGTPEAVATAGKIVFWEDVHEEIYRLDRMLTQWKRAGRFDGVAGVIIGTLENIRHNGKDDAGALSALLSDHFGEAPFPVVRDWPAGHGRLNRALALGGEVAIDTARGVARLARAVA
jgi:muramoyltetrapeptide carboxypeptidase